MLLYRKCDPERNINEPTIESIPHQLTATFEDESEKRKGEEEEKEKERQNIVVKAYYKGDIKQIKINKTETIKLALEMILKEYGLENTPEGCARLREFQSQMEIAQKPYTEVDKPLSDFSFFNSKTVVLEIKSPEEEFPPYDSHKMVLRIFVHNKETDTWGDVDHIYVDKNANLGELREELAKVTGIPAEEQVICKESYNRLNATILIGDNLILRMHHSIYEGIKLWVEHRHEGVKNDDYRVDINRLNLEQIKNMKWPRAFEEITKVKNVIEVKFGDADSTDYKHSIKVSRQITLRELKELIGKKNRLITR